MSIDCIFKHTKEDALKDFIFFDEKTIPLEDVKPVILQPLQPTSAIIITGYIPVHAIRFSINLNCKTSGNIALHFNPRIDRGYVVRNTKIKGTWEIEETCSPVGPCNYIFRRNSYIHLMIFCTEDAFQIAINGEHFCAFTYRFPLSDIKNLECEGHIEDIRYNQLNLNVYPDPKIFKPSRSLSLTVDSPLVEFLYLTASKSEDWYSRLMPPTLRFGLTEPPGDGYFGGEEAGVRNKGALVIISRNESS